jgi:hypothetical protein
MGSRFYLAYHQDSGTKQSDMATGDKTYDPYFYDRHTGSGLMELVAWGNLTDISAGWTLKPSDTTDAGLAYHMFSKTEKEDMVRPGTYGQNLFLNNNMCSPTGAAGAPGCSSAIGNEIDVWAEHRYDGGLSILARLGYFMPGGTLKDSVVNETASITQVMVQGKLTF